MRRRDVLEASAAFGTVGLAGCQGLLGDDEDEGGDGNGDGGEDGDASLPRLQTDGKWIVDEDGNEVVLRGVNLVEPLFCDANAQNRGGDYDETLELALDESAGWYNRVIRLPINYWGAQGDGLDQHLDGDMEAYFEEYVDPTVDRCAEENAYLIVDYHLIENWDDEEVHANVEEFWDFTAERYADEPHVLYEPFNEPVEPSEDSLENWEAFKEVFQPWIDQIREDAPDTPIIVGSPDFTSHTKYAAESPMEGENLIYAGHIYPGEGDSPEDWNPEYGDVADEVPVLLTEWGYEATDDSQPGDREWGESFREWVDGKENVGWTAWALGSHWIPAMLDFDFNVKGGEYFHGWFVKEWLYDTRNDGVPEVAQSGEDAEFEGPPENVSPNVPTNVDMEVTGEGEISFSWEHEARTEEATVAHYNLYVNDEVQAQPTMLTLANEQGGGDFTQDTYEFEWPVSGLGPDQEHSIYVTAVDSLSNESAPSRFLDYQPDFVREIDAELQRTDEAPTIDGEVDGVWEDATAHEMDNVPLGEVESEDDLSGSWRGLWDDDTLYVLVDVTDDALSIDNEEELYQNDSIELFVDVDNDKQSEYTSNDYQMVFERESGRRSDEAVPGGMDSVESAQTETDGGYRFEAALPWDVLEPEDPIEAGATLGFDVHVNDDDEGNSREAKISWHDEEDAAWEDPSAFGSLELVE